MVTGVFITDENSCFSLTVSDLLVNLAQQLAMVYSPGLSCLVCCVLSFSSASFLNVVNLLCGMQGSANYKCGSAL